MYSSPPNADEPTPGARAYRAFYLSHDGRVLKVESIDAQTDEEAEATAQRMVNGHGVDLWERYRFLASYPPLADQA